MKMNNQFWSLVAVDRQGFQYDYDLGKWFPYKEYHGNYYPGGFPCKSYKAAIRHLRKHNEIPKGTQFRLVSRFVGCDRYLTK